jgi:hypothetical protein
VGLNRGSLRSDPERVIRASELGEFGFCPRAWWLSRVLGLEGANQEQRDRGKEVHRRHGRAVWLSLLARRLAIALLLIASGIAAVLIVTHNFFR